MKIGCGAIASMPPTNAGKRWTAFCDEKEFLLAPYWEANINDVRVAKGIIKDSLYGSSKSSGP